MSVVSVNEFIDGRSGTEGDKGVREYVRVFIVVTNDVRDGPATVRAAVGLPKRGDIYATGTDIDSGAVVTTIDPSQESGAPKVWKVTVTYSSAYDPAEEEENPLLRPAVLTWDNSLFSKPATKTTTGGAICNHANESFDPAPEMEDVRATLLVQRNLATFNEVTAFGYTNRMNLTAWMGGAAKTWKIQKLSAVSRTENDFTFWDVTGEFAYNPDTWDLVVLNQGYHHLDGTAVVVNTDTDGTVFSSPQMLTTAGALLGSGGTPTFRTFQVYGTVEFSILGLI